MSALVFLLSSKPSRLKVELGLTSFNAYLARLQLLLQLERRKSMTRSKNKSCASCLRNDHYLCGQSLFHLIIKYMTSYKSSPERFSDRFSSKHSPPVPELPSQEKMSSLECSEVRDSPSEEQMLAASEVSWLDKIGEDNNKNKQSERSHHNDCHYYEKQTNSMKFSFNKNDMEISRPRVSGTREALNQQQTLK